MKLNCIKYLWGLITIYLSQLVTEMEKRLVILVRHKMIVSFLGQQL